MVFVRDFRIRIQIKLNWIRSLGIFTYNLKTSRRENELSKQSRARVELGFLILVFTRLDGSKEVVTVSKYAAVPRFLSTYTVHCAVGAVDFHISRLGIRGHWALAIGISKCNCKIIGHLLICANVI